MRGHRAADDHRANRGLDHAPATVDADDLVVHGWLYPYLPVDTSSSQARDLTNVDAACVLERAIESAQSQFSADISGQLVEAGPATSLLDTVRDGDLLVIGSRGRGALAAHLFGSTVNTVLDRSAVPVVVVRGAASAA